MLTEALCDKIPVMPLVTGCGWLPSGPETSNGIQSRAGKDGFSSTNQSAEFCPSLGPPNVSHSLWSSVGARANINLLVCDQQFSQRNSREREREWREREDRFILRNWLV